MEIAIRGNVQVSARIENLGDLINVGRGFFKSQFVKAIEVPSFDLATSYDDSCLSGRGRSCLPCPSTILHSSAFLSVKTDLPAAVMPLPRSDCQEKCSADRQSLPERRYNTR